MKFKYAVAVVLIAVFTLAGYYYFKQSQPKQFFKIENIDLKEVSGELQILVKGRNSTSVNIISVKVEFPNGEHIPLNAVYGKSGVWAASTSLVEEGVYRVCVLDPYFNESLVCRNFTFYDKPLIEKVDLKIGDGSLVVDVTTRDLSGIEKVLFSFNGKNYTLTAFQVDSRGNGLWRTRIKIDADKINYKIIAVDKSDRKIASVKKGSFSLSELDKFILEASKHGLNREEAEKLYQREFIKELYREGMLDFKLIAGNKKLAFEIVDQIDRGVEEKLKKQVFLKAIPLIQGIEKYEKAFVYIPGNYTLAIINGCPETGEIKQLAEFNETLKPVELRGWKLYPITPYKAYWLLAAEANINQSLLRESHEEVAAWIIADTYQLLEILKVKPEKAVKLAYKHWQVMPRLTELKQTIPDKNTRKAILVIQYTVPLRAWNIENKQEIWGLEAYQYHITQTPKTAKQILKDWKENKLIKHYPTGDLIDPRCHWYARVDDWGDQGAREAQIQLTGFGYQAFDGWDDPRAKNPDSYALQFNSPNTFLTKNWKAKIYYPWLNKTEEIKPWDLYRYAEGYTLEVIKGPPWITIYNKEMVMKLLGIPVIWQRVDLAPKDTSLTVYGVMLVPIGIPDSIYKEITDGRYGKIAKIPLNGIEQMSMQEGLQKDTTRPERPYVVKGTVFIPIWKENLEIEKAILYFIKRPS